MKRVLVLTFLLIALMSYSQKGQVNYGFIESLNIGNAIGEDYNAILNFDTNNSEYVTGKINLEKSENLNKQQVFENPNGGGGFISEGLLVTLNGNQVIVDKKANTMLSNIKYGKQILNIRNLS